MATTKTPKKKGKYSSIPGAGKFSKAKLDSVYKRGLGAYYSSVTGAASQVSERAGIPWVNGESTSPKLRTLRFLYF